LYRTNSIISSITNINLSAAKLNAINITSSNIKVSDTLTSLYIDATSVSIGSLAIGTMCSIYYLQNYRNATSDTTLVFAGNTIKANYQAGNNTILISGNEITGNYVNTVASNTASIRSLRQLMEIPHRLLV
jgi:hypothetical protein